LADLLQNSLTNYIHPDGETNEKDFMGTALPLADPSISGQLPDNRIQYPTYPARAFERSRPRRTLRVRRTGQ
jgi:hypothetical protein